MQVSSLLSRKEIHEHHHDHEEDCGSCGHDHDHTQFKLNTMIAGVVLIANSFFMEWFGGTDDRIAGISAFIGAIILGYPILKLAVKSILRGMLTINELVAIAFLAAIASGESQLGGYQTAGIVAFFMLLGELIETRTAAGARASIASLVKMTPTKARRIVAAGEQEVTASELNVGDVIRIRPGDNVAADGKIIKGQGSINQANITGESLPVDKTTGEEVFAGTTNLNGVLEVKITRAGEDTTFGRVRDLILSAEQTKLPIMRIIDQYMGYYTPLVLVIAAVVWFFTQDIERVVSVLVISCPCAFILASPTAMVAALASAARLGILIKNVGDIEIAARINAFVFDKTGTLTTGELAVSRLAPQGDLKPAELLKIAATAEKFSNHPTAKALVNLAEEAGVTLVDPTDFKETAGRGVQAKVDDESIVIGRAQWLRDNGVTDDFESKVDLKEAEGYSLLFVARGGECIGWIGLQDATRSEAKEALADLLESGVRRVAMVSGDRQPVAARVAAEIGCGEVVAECLPQDKVDFVNDLKKRGYRVAVIGDGVNDAPALAAGDMGVAMGAAGSEVAIQSATIALMNSDLRRLPFLMRLSRQTRKVINQNFLFGILFIIGGMIGASYGVINPIVAAVLHNAGSLIVVFNSARLVRQGEELGSFEPESTPASTDDTVGMAPQPA
ncbi:MAG: cation-translocating P-type ATPase [Verrucomicrobia bacterium]|jgi:Cd2+/Zn2+-exporting ATPase|nr:cation-translocating P-type ATPase [Verrucomicrobiota bacterium]MBT3842806.1 cation-translocating P-type ATPase [Verrucomicrobiota bacterium]MBT4901212.1 cation-translocating P-type ATPase [Verrucomicrobiota bacterium]MBT5620385.1 cation-translocating P-type ATPase [Verrucomicrobiota bacterium]MBT6103585.1 cation-translocating P-type ATPase [Verrucomicrobiota bacterium]